MRIEDAKKAIELNRAIQTTRSDFKAAASEDAYVEVAIIKDGKGGMCRRRMEISCEMAEIILNDVRVASAAKLTSLRSLSRRVRESLSTQKQS